MKTPRLDCDGNEVYRLLVLSINHLTQVGNDELLSYSMQDSTSILEVPDSGFILNAIVVRESYDISKELDELLVWAHENGYVYLKFDLCGPIVKDLPVFDW